MTKIGWIGLGVMGAPMAGHLSQHTGTKLSVYNRTLEKARTWCASYTGQIAKSPADTAQNADIVFCCVGDDPDVLDVTLGAHGAFDAMKPGSIFIDHTTTSATLARKLAAEAKKRGCFFIDAPVSGGQAGAQNGQLSIMAGGDGAAIECARPFLALYAKNLSHMGPSGSGQLTKMVNQICIAGLLQSLSEGLNFAACADLDVAKVMDVITQGAATSWQMENRWQSMSADQFDFGFAVDWMRKDLRHCLAEAKRNGAALPVAKIIDGYYADIQKKGGGRMDTSSLITRLPRPKSLS